jgi:hypothetical protein
MDIYVGKVTCLFFFADLINLLLSPAKDHLSAGFAGSVLKFFNKLLHFGRQFEMFGFISLNHL